MAAAAKLVVQAALRVLPAPLSGTDPQPAIVVPPTKGHRMNANAAHVASSEPTLRTYHFLPSVRGDLLAKLGRSEEARAEFERAAALTQNARERELLLGRAAACSRM